MRSARKGTGAFFERGLTTTPAPLIDAERIGAVSVEQLRRAHPAFPHERLYARQRQFQLHRLGRDGNEQAGLRGLRLHRVDAHPQVHDRGRRAGALPDRVATA